MGQPNGATLWGNLPHTPGDKERERERERDKERERETQRQRERDKDKEREAFERPPSNTGLQPGLSRCGRAAYDANT